MVMIIYLAMMRIVTVLTSSFYSNYKCFAFLLSDRIIYYTSTLYFKKCDYSYLNFIFTSVS